MSTDTAYFVSEITPERLRAMRKKRFVRRLLKDRSQQVRQTVQVAFLALNVWIAIDFLVWTHYFETQGQSRYIDRPGRRRWMASHCRVDEPEVLPLTHHVPAVHPSAMVLVGIFLLSSLLLKKTFCSWLCPVGTISEALWKLVANCFVATSPFPDGSISLCAA